MADFNYVQYWEEHYQAGGNSGSGSYGILAEWKAKIINGFLESHHVESVIDFGCGDGNQISLIHYPKYLGLDVSLKSIELCLGRFINDSNKAFQHYESGKTQLPHCDLAVCLDVLYHITDEKDYFTTLNDIFLSSEKFIILYTTLESYKYQVLKPYAGMYHRNTLEHLKRYPEWGIEIIKQKYPEKSGSDFLILIKEEL